MREKERQTDRQRSREAYRKRDKRASVFELGEVDLYLYRLYYRPTLCQTRVNKQNIESERERERD